MSNLISLQNFKSHQPISPNDVHYSAKVDALTTEEAAKHWISHAHKAMLYELAEEIDSGQYQVGSDWWIAQVHRRAIELIEADSDLRPGYTTQILQSINDNALFHYAGYESAEEWFAAESSGLKKSGYKYDLQWWAGTLIPYVKTKKILPEPDRYFWTAKNTDGNSRYLRLRDATPDLRRVIEDENNFIRESVEIDLETSFKYPKGTPQFGREAQKRTEAKQKEAIKTILDAVASPEFSRKELKEELNNIRAAKPIIRMYRNGDNWWHVEGFNLSDRQMDRFFKNNEFSALIQIVDPPEVDR